MSKEQDNPIEFIRTEFLQDKKFLDLSIDFTYIIVFEKVNGKNCIAPIIHDLEDLDKLKDFTNKFIKEFKLAKTKYIIYYEKLKDNVFNGFIYSVQKEKELIYNKINYLDQERIVYEEEQKENYMLI